MERKGLFLIHSEPIISLWTFDWTFVKYNKSRITIIKFKNLDNIYDVLVTYRPNKEEINDKR